MDVKVPDDFKELLKKEHPDAWEEILMAIFEPSKTSIRKNKFKQHALEHLPIGDPVAWCENGFWLKERPSFTFDPFFHSGYYYVQEASSMFLEQVFKNIFPNEMPLKVLDLCAAPGGKSTHLLNLLSEDSLLVANEVIQTRVGVLAENVSKWGTTNYIVTNNDPKDFSVLEGFFDVVLVDAPCSGEGLFRKDESAREEWTLDNVKLCAGRQKRILEQAINTLKPGGYLIYSTCTFNKMEDEEQLEFMKNEFGLKEVQLKVDNDLMNKLGLNAQWNSSYKFLPHKSEGEGFFIGCLQKPEGKEFKKLRYKSKLSSPNKNQWNSIKNWIPEIEQLHAFIFNNELYLCPKDISWDMENILHSGLKIKASGLHAGVFHRDDFSPSHELALSTINFHSPHILSLDYEAAIAYLQKKDFTFESARNIGWNLVQYKGANLGWAKVMGNRINNYYPQEWRIRKEILKLRP